MRVLDKLGFKKVGAMTKRIALVFIVGMLLSPAASAQPAQEEAVLRALIAAHEHASVSGDLRGLVDVYSLDAELVSATGVVTRGRDAIEASYRQQLAGAAAKSGRHHTHPPDGIRIRFVTPEVALIDLPSRNVGGRTADGAEMPPNEVTLITVWRKTGGTWLVVSQRALPVVK